MPEKYYCGLTDAVVAGYVNIKMLFARQPVRQNEMIFAEALLMERKEVLQRLGRSGPSRCLYDSVSRIQVIQGSERC
jgi:hypothetical protein